jgi:hypothetical protein
VTRGIATFTQCLIWIIELIVNVIFLVNLSLSLCSKVDHETDKIWASVYGIARVEQVSMKSDFAGPCYAQPRQDPLDPEGCNQIF